MLAFLALRALLCLFVCLIACLVDVDKIIVVLKLVAAATSYQVRTITIQAMAHRQVSVKTVTIQAVWSR